MKKFLLVALFAVLAISCSKQVEVKGKISNGGPLERIEIIEASGVATLPLVNFGTNADGTFNAKFDAPKDGMYVVTYAGRQNLFYIKQGQTLELVGDGAVFPREFKIIGAGKENNEFLKQTQEYLDKYVAKLNVQQIMGKDEAGFVKDIQKIEADLNKNIEETAKKVSPDNQVVTWKKNDIKSGLLTIFPQYEAYRKQVSGPTFAPSKAFKDLENKLQENKDELLKNHPVYRSYLLGKITPDFQTFAQTATQGKPDILTTEVFVQYLKKRSDLSQLTKDYLVSFVLAQSDLRPGLTKIQSDKISKIIDTDIKDSTIKADMKKAKFAIGGFVDGDKAVDAPLQTQDGKAYAITETKGRPKVVMMYASWTPYISEAQMPVLKDVVNFYKSKVDFVYVDFDDTKEQFLKTSKSLFKGIPGTNVYPEGGLKSKFAEAYGVYGFKLAPMYLVIDKDGKIAGKPIFNLGEAEFLTTMEKVSGLKAPQIQQQQPPMPQATLQVDPAAAAAK